MSCFRECGISFLQIDQIIIFRTVSVCRLYQMTSLGDYIAASADFLNSLPDGAVRQQASEEVFQRLLRTISSAKSLSMADAAAANQQLTLMRFSPEKLAELHGKVLDATVDKKQ